MSDNCIFVVTHKPFDLDNNIRKKGYKLISVGGTSLKDPEASYDNTGDNISIKNPNYCELTAVYWIWKNSNSDIKGFCHYRRYFTNHTIKYTPNKVLDLKRAERLIRERNAVILPERKYYTVSARELYLRCGRQKDLDTTRQVILEKYPEYIDEYDKMLEGNSGYITNMLIASSKVFDAYCKWLFDILFEVERRSDITGYTREEARIYGYLSERLLGLWLHHNKINIVEMQSINPETDNTIKYVAYRVFMGLNIYKTSKNIIFRIHKIKN